MHKRRERDRPKAAPGSLYNPHKRVLLSYGSEDEEGRDEQRSTAYAHPADDEDTKLPAVSDEGNQRTVAPEVDKSIDKDLEVTSLPETSSAANKADIVAENPKDQYESRRTTRRNETTGQWAALGSLSYQWDDDDYVDEEEYDSAEEDARAYLRAVRYERQSLPYVLTAASNDDSSESGVGDTRGRISDGTYVVSANIGPQIPVAAKRAIDPQEAYTEALKERFSKQRAELHRPPAPGSIDGLDNDHPISFPWRNRKAHATWIRILRMVSPHPAQIQAMQQDDIFNVLRLLHKDFLVREKHLPPTTSSWIWALLAKLDDVGTMNNDQVWNLRELGKKAILVQLALDDADAAAELEATAPDAQRKRNAREEKVAMPRDMAIVDSKPGDEDGEASLNAGEDNDQEEDSAERQHTLATLDTILVVVGDIYGQRDLLEFRKCWTATSDD